MKPMIYLEKEGEAILQKIDSAKRKTIMYVIIRCLVIVCVVLFSTGTIYAQELTVKGTVVDINNEPLIGAFIKAVNENVGTASQEDGSFTLRVPNANVLLEISYVGFVSQLIKASDTNALNRIVLKENSKELGEVVVTALGMKREQKAIGYSMTELKGESMLTNDFNPVASLQGKVAGLEIAGSDGGMFGSVKIQIRGASTLQPNNQPIFVVDGVILDNAVSNVGVEYAQDPNDWGNELKGLNPSDFETVSILKGAAATALYGSRGLNGAVVITTKSGKKQYGMGINITQTFGASYYYKQPDLQYYRGHGVQARSVNYGEQWNDNGTMRYHQWDNYRQFRLAADGIPTYIGTSSYGFGPKFDGRPIHTYDQSIVAYEPYKNGIKDFYNIGTNATTNVSFQGGTEKTTYYNSISYRHANGTLPNNTLDLFTVLTKASHEFSKYLSMGASMTYSNARPANPQPNITEDFIQGRLHNDYNPKLYKYKYKGPHGGMATGDDEYAYVPDKGIWWNLFENDRYQKEISFRPSLEMTITMTDWLRLRLEGNYNYFYKRNEQKELGSGYAMEGGSYRLGQYSKEQTNGYATLTANKIFGDLRVDGFLRGEYFDNREQNGEMWTDGGLIIPGQFFMNNSKNAVQRSNAGISGTKRILSTSFSANTAWKEQLFLSVTGRNDWSSALVYSTGQGNYSYFYPSVSASWVLSSTLDLPKWISFAKLRASWAQVGNDTSPYSINSAYSLNTMISNYGTLYSLSIPNDVKSLNLKPERKNSIEFGFDWRFFDGRSNIDLAYYRDNTIDQIISIPVPSESGISSQMVNAGNVQGEGVELALNFVPVRSKDWEWKVDFTYTRHAGKVIKLHENVANWITLEGQSGGDFMLWSAAQENGEYGVILTNIAPLKDKETGLDLYSWNDQRRQPLLQRSGETQKVGKITPDFLGGLITDLRWKSLSLRVAFDTDIGRYVASYPSRYGKAYGQTEASLKYSDAAHGGVTWTSKFDEKLTYDDGVIPTGIVRGGSVITQPDGSIYTVKDGGEKFTDLLDRGLVEPVHASLWHLYGNSWGAGVLDSDWYGKADFLALREVTLSYQFPFKIANMIKAKRLHASLSGRNLCYLINTTPSHENPESVRGTRSGEFRLRSFMGFTANYYLTINASF